MIESLLKREDLLYGTQKIYKDNLEYLDFRGVVKIGIPLLHLLETRELFGSSILAGWDGVGNYINSLSIVEAPMAIDLVYEKDLVFSSGYFLKDKTNEFLECIQKIYKKGASGIGIPPDTYIKRIPDEVIELCDQLKFPLIALPTNFRFSSAAFSLFKVLEKNKNYDEYIPTDLASRTLKLIINGLPFPAILQMLADELRCHIFFQDIAQLNLLVISCKEATTSIPERQLEIDYLKNQNDDIVDYLNLQNEQTIELVYPLYQNKEMVNKLVYRGSKSILLDNYDDLIRVCFIINSAYVNIMRTIEQLKVDKQNFFFNLLFKKDYTYESSYFIPDNYFKNSGRIISIYFSDLNNKAYRKKECLKKLEVRLQAQDTFGLITATDKFIVILYHHHNTDSPEFKNLIIDICKIIKSYASVDFGLGIGSIANNGEKYQKSFQEAKQAAEICFQINKNNFLEYKDLGIFKLIENEKSLQFYTRLAEDLLEPVLLLPENEKMEILNSVKSYFEAGCSFALAAKKLFIHENTLRYRIQKLEELLNLDFKNWENRFLLFFVDKVLDISLNKS